MAETLIATAAGEFGTSFLAKEATKIGIKQFIQTYGSVAFRTVSPVIAGGMLFEKVVEAYPPIDLQKEKLFGTPISSLPGMPTTYYDDTKYFKKPEPLKFGQIFRPDADEMEKERQRIIDREKERLKGPPPIEPAPPLITPVPKEKKFEPPSSPPVELPELEGFPDLSEELNKPQIFTKDKPKDITKQTEELVPKIKNKITTWEDHFPTIEEATKAAKDVGGTLREFKEGVIQKKTTFRKQGDGFGFDIYFDKKYIGELTEVDPYKEDSMRKEIFGNTKSYVLRYINEDGYLQDGDITLDGQKYAKEKTKELVARDLLQESSDFRSLRKIFQEMEYNKKGEPITEGERTKDISKQTKDLVKEEPEFGALTEVEKERIQEQTEKLTSKITLEKIRSDVKFKQSKYTNTTDVYYKGKKYAEIEKRDDKPKLRGLVDYDLKFPSGTFLEDGEEIFTVEDAEHGFKDAKEIVINTILGDLKRKK